MLSRSILTRAVSILASGLLLTLGMALFAGQATAQDSAATAHPAHIHAGTCSELGDVIYPLTDVESSSTMGTPAAGEMIGTPAAMSAMTSPTSDDMMMGTPEASPTAIGAEMSVTTVETSLSDLTGGEYAINVHESMDNIGNYIACGNIAGTVENGTDLTVQLDTLNDSGYSGTAKLHDNGDGTTTVTIDLMHDDTM